MYSVSKFYDRQMTAFSVPPPAHPSLSDDFQELSRIHFYLGRSPIDFMIQAVEKASPQEVEKGEIQICFAAKEIQEFFSGSWSNISPFVEDKLNPSLYFDKTFKDILGHAIKVLDNAYKSPTKKNNVVTIETMLGLAHEVAFFNESLQKAGVQTQDISELFTQVKDKYQKIYNLKGNYPNLEKLKEFDSYSEDAQKSVIEQLKQPYDFNYAEISKIYFDDGYWIHTLQGLLEKQKEMNSNPDYKFNTEEYQELKDDFLKQIKSFNRLLKNGVVNYSLSFAASISQEAFRMIGKSQLSAEAYFERELNYHKNSLKSYFNRDYHEEKIKELEKTKDAYIQQRVDDKTFYKEYLTVLHRQEKNILHSLDKVKANLLGFELKETITFNGDIDNGFVVGTFSNVDKVLLVHKDPFVDVPEAVYAMILPKEKYENLVATNNLVFDEKLRESEFQNASNFWSYGQFLHEISSPDVQNFFLGQKFDLVDNTVINETKKKKLRH